ncbi:hypothetical protein [Maribacter litoralis]|uniref:Four helix bundle protein n=1 Tax=Maribacter litoralis TaxID=2059726 RepID=A0A653ULM4_9FLAO|nr:hypothetical protein [Maribacter litoralis]VXB90286.1 conserved hypothetical protein [Maribacter litoralis]
MAYRSLKHLPIYRKALELCTMSREIASYVTFNKDLMRLCESKSLRDIMANSILTDSILIPQKIAQVEYSSCTNERKETISYINIIIRNINSYCMGLEKHGVKETEYINLLRKEIKSFRKSYKAWKAEHS